MHQIIIIIAKYFIVLPVVAAAYLFFKQDAAHRKDMIIFSIISVVIAVILTKLATTVIHDPRPFISDGVKPYFSSSNDNGFPSDHTVFSAVLAFIALRYSRKVGLLLLGTALLIGASRVLAGVHHGKDIVGGLAIALVSFGITSLVMRTKVNNKRVVELP